MDLRRVTIVIKAVNAKIKCHAYRAERIALHQMTPAAPVTTGREARCEASPGIFRLASAD
jgi:hypothetical protein